MISIEVHPLNPILNQELRELMKINIESIRVSSKGNRAFIHFKDHELAIIFKLKFSKLIANNNV